LAPNQTVTLEYDESRFDREGTSIEGGRIDGSVQERLVSARWSYNTTNEPFFPTRGTLLSVAPHYGWTDGLQRHWDTGTSTPQIVPFHSRTHGLTVNATRFVELTPRSSVWGDVRGEWAEIDQGGDDPDYDFYDSSASSVGVGAGYGFSLWSPERRAYGDSRIELTARYAHRVDPAYPPYRKNGKNVYQTSAAWVRRTSWGTLRLGVGYAW
jgi:hypothetical protein